MLTYIDTVPRLSYIQPLDSLASEVGVLFFCGHFYLFFASGAVGVWPPSSRHPTKHIGIAGLRAERQPPAWHPRPKRTHKVQAAWRACTHTHAQEYVGRAKRGREI